MLHRRQRVNVDGSDSTNSRTAAICLSSEMNAKSSTLITRRSSKHRARRSHGRHGAPAAGTRARALGRHREGKSAYNDLFALWKNSDAQIPIVKEARAEYARLP
jgi:hypothetical protein